MNYHQHVVPDMDWDSLIDDLVSLVPQSIDDETQSPSAYRGWGRDPIRPDDTKPKLPIRCFPKLNGAPGNRNALTYRLICQ